MGGDRSSFVCAMRVIKPIQKPDTHTFYHGQLHHPHNLKYTTIHEIGVAKSSLFVSQETNNAIQVSGKTGQRSKAVC